MRYFLAAIFMLSFGCRATETLYWYVSASFVNPAQKIAEKFNIGQHLCNVVVVTGGSGELLSKIILSKTGDIYMPASDEFLEKINKSGLVETYRKFLLQKPVFGLSRKMAEKRLTFQDLITSKYKLAAGNPETMATATVYQKLKTCLNKKTAETLTGNECVYPLNVTQSLNYLRTGVVDAVIITDVVAKINGIDFIEFPKEYSFPMFSYLVILKVSKNLKSAVEFEKFIIDNSKIFTDNGYSIVGNDRDSL